MTILRGLTGRRPQHEVGAIALRFEVVENHLIEGWFVARAFASFFVAVGDGRVVVIRNEDLARKLFEPPGVDSLDNRAVLAFHERRHGFFVDFLLDQIVVRGAPGVENFTACIDKRLHKGVVSPLVLGLHMVGGARVLDVRVVPS